MKICPACHQETFDGRSTCHRCGSDVSRARQLELPTSDVATLHTRLPLHRKRGRLELTLAGVRFTASSGEALLEVPTRQIQSVEPRGASEMILNYASEDGAERSARFRVHWAPQADQGRGPQKTEVMLVAYTFRAVMMHGSPKKRVQRDREVVRDRWLWSIRALLSSDRYAVGRRRSSSVDGNY